MKRIIPLALMALLLFAASCKPAVPAPAVPSDRNSATLSPTSPDTDIPVACNTANGNVFVPNGSMPKTDTVSIRCIGATEKKELETMVKKQTSSTNVVLGAVELLPSYPPFQFTKDVTITVPLDPQRSDLKGKSVDLYVYSPDSGKFFKASQARVDSYGLTATAKVNHFSIFILVGPAEEGTAGGEVPPEPPTEPPAGFTCNDPLGCVAVAPDGPVRIAGLLDFSSQGELSAAALDGINSAINEMGNIAGHWIEIVTLDGGCIVETGASAANQFTADPQIAGVVGTICSASASQARQILDKAGYVMVSPGNTRNAYTLSESERLDGFFRVATPEIYQAYGMAEFAYNNLGARRMAIFYAEGQFGEPLAEGFTQRFAELGGQTVLSESVSPGQSGFYGQMERLSSSEVDAVYMPLFSAEAGYFTAYVREFGMDFPLLGADAINNAEFLGIAGGAAENVYFSYTDPSVMFNPSAYGYDAARLLLEAIARIAVPTEDGTLYIGRQALREALHGVSFNGQTGPVSCNGAGDCGHAQVAVYLFREGQPNEVYRYSP